MNGSKSINFLSDMEDLHLALERKQELMEKILGVSSEFINLKK